MYAVGKTLRRLWCYVLWFFHIFCVNHVNLWFCKNIKGLAATDSMLFGRNAHNSNFKMFCDKLILFSLSVFTSLTWAAISTPQSTFVVTPPNLPRPSASLSGSRLPLLENVEFTIENDLVNVLITSSLHAHKTHYLKTNMKQIFDTLPILCSIIPFQWFIWWFVFNWRGDLESITIQYDFKNCNQSSLVDCWC